MPRGRNRWKDARSNIERARDFVSRYDLDKVNPEEFQPRGAEQDEWEKLIRDVE